MRKNLLTIIPAILVLALGAYVLLTHPGRIRAKDKTAIEEAGKQLVADLVTSYSQMDMPGFYRHFSRDPKALHIYGMKCYTSVDSLTAQLKADFGQVREMRLAIQGSQVMPIDSKHALVTAQGSVRYGFVNGTESAVMIFNWSFFIEKTGKDWVIVRSQQGFSQ
jgi:hypothetical protein